MAGLDKLNDFGAKRPEVKKAPAAAEAPQAAPLSAPAAVAASVPRLPLVGETVRWNGREGTVTATEWNNRTGVGKVEVFGKWFELAALER